MYFVFNIKLNFELQCCVNTCIFGLLQWAFILLIFIGFNWWLKPLKYYPKDPNSRFNRVLRLLIRSSAIEEQQSLLSPQQSDDFTPNNDSGEMMEYHQLSKSDPSDCDEINASSDEETKI